MRDDMFARHFAIRRRTDILLSVPSIRIEGPYEMYFTSHDRGEPPHVHVSRENMSAKVWLSSVRVAYNLGFSRHELRRIERLITAHEQLCLRKWHEYFGT
jgi:hypothetical protein